MKCVTVTPEKTIFDQTATFVVLPLYDGEYGIDEDHSPIVGRLGAGELRLTLEDKSVEHWYVEGGFVEVANNIVSLLTNRACKAEDLDVNVAREELARALALPSNSPELNDVKIETVDRARAKLRVAEKGKLVSRK